MAEFITGARVTIEAGLMMGREFLFPKSFLPLVQGLSEGEFFLVYCDQDEKRSSVGISDRKARGVDDDLTTEITYVQEDGKLLLEVRKAINEKGWWDNQDRWGPDGLEKPHGNAQAEYQIFGENRSRLVSFRSLRFDETTANIGGETMPARWSRSLDIEVDEGGKRKLYYRDYFIVGNVGKGNEKRAGISFKIVGSVDSPERALVEIDGGPEEGAKILYEDKVSHLKVLVHPPFGETQLQMLSQNPEYVFLDNEKITVPEIMALIRYKIDLLSNHWHEPESVLKKRTSTLPPAPKMLPV